MEPPTLNTAENWQGFGKAHRDFLVKYEQLQDLLLPLLQVDSEILDICCGTSRLCVQLVQAGYPCVTGVDYEESAIQLQQKVPSEA